MKKNDTSRQAIWYPALFLFTLSVLATTFTARAAPWAVVSNTPQQVEFTVETSWDDLVLAETKANGQVFTRLGLPNAITSKQAGSPELPVWSTLLETPANCQFEITVLDEQWEEKSFKELGVQYPILPVQPSIRKTGPAPKFAWDQSIYDTNDWFGPEQVRVETQGTVRGRGVALLRTSAVEYQPVEKSLRLCRKLQVRIDFQDKQGKQINKLSQTIDQSPLFNPVYGKLLNYPLGKVTKDVTDDQVRYPISYLLVAPDNLLGNAKLNEFITWKEQKGFDVIANYISSTATTTDIDTWIENQYNSISPAPSFVLLVGDESGTYRVPASVNPSDPASAAVTRSDLLYGVMGTVSTTNNIPSMYVGRFSVRSLGDLEAQVDKTLWYEKNQFSVPTPDLDYLRAPLGAAGADSNMATPYGNPQISYGWTHYFTASNGMDQAIHYLHPTAATMDSQIISHISSGVSLYNYTAHGSETSFGDPSFSISNIDSLSNNGKYPLVIGNCCLTGSYGTAECFGEAWLNAPNKGAIGYIGASMSTYWNEDLAMGVGTIDAYNDQNPPLSTDDPGMYDGWMNDGWSTVGGGKHAGLLAVNRYASDFTHAYWLSYTTFGDPSLSVFFGIPTTVSATYSNIYDPSGTFSVSTDPGIYVAASKDGQVLDAGYTGTGTEVQLSIPPSVVDGFTLTLTGANRQPLVDQISVGSLDRPFIVPSLHAVSGAVSGQTAHLDVLLRNLGQVNASSVEASFTSSSPYVTALTGNATFGAIASNNQLIATSAVNATLTPIVPDGETIQIDYTATVPGYDPITVPLKLTVSAPDVTAIYQTNYVEASNELELAITLTNNGGATANYPQVVLSSTSSQVLSIPDPLGTIEQLASGSSHTFDFVVELDPTIPTPYLIEYCTSISGDNIVIQNTCKQTSLGLTDDFESGSWKSFWELGGSANWRIVLVDPKENAYVAQAGDISDNQASIMSVNIEAEENAQVTFDLRVSSESDYDYLSIYSNDALLQQWSGEVSWSSVTLDLPMGQQELTFQYSKDSSSDAGEDSAWIDNILLIQASILAPFNLQCNTTELNMTCNTDEQNTMMLDLANLGDVSGNVTLKIIANSTDLFIDTDFESDPTDWTIAAAAGTSGLWTRSNSRSGDSFGTGYFMIADSDSHGSQAMSTTLISPLVTVPANTPIILEYDHFFKYYADGAAEEAHVYLIENGTWNLLWSSGSADEGSWGSPSHGEHNVSYTEPTEVQIVFYYLNANFDWYWAVDNVSLHKETPLWCLCDGDPTMNIELDSSESVNIPINFNSNGMSLGAHHLTLRLTSSSGSITDIPITMTITDTPTVTSDVFLIH